MDVVVVPVKALRAAKGRLAPRYDGSTRHNLAVMLLRDVIALAKATSSLTWYALTADEEAAALAREGGLEILEDPGGGLNAALGKVAAELAQGGASSLTVLPVDVPLATPNDLTDLLDTGATSEIVVVPSGEDGGTNALYLSPPDLIAPRFGPASLNAHIAMAEQRSLRCTILSLPRLALDLDVPEDVERFLAHPRAPETHTGRFLAG